MQMLPVLEGPYQWKPDMSMWTIVIFTITAPALMPEAYQITVLKRKEAICL